MAKCENCEHLLTVNEGKGYSHVPLCGLREEDADTLRIIALCHAKDLAGFRPDWCPLLKEAGGDAADALRVVIVPAGGAAEAKGIDNTLKALQEAVGGHIEAVTIAIHEHGERHEYIVLVDEEGKLKGLRPNILWIGDMLVGNVVITKKGDDGEFASLDDGDVGRVTWWARNYQVPYLVPSDYGQG